MWATVAHRDTKALCRTENNIRALFTWSRQQDQRHKISRDADNHFAGFQLSNQCAVVVNVTGGADLLQQHAKHILMIEDFVGVVDNHVKTKGFGTGTNHIKRLRMHVRCHEEAVGIFQFAHALRHCHCFGGGGGFIQQ